MRLIDADAKGLEQRINNNFGGVTRFILKSILKGEPTIDAVPVVRCRECKYLMFSDCYGECSKGHLGIVRQDDFCSRGERKEGDK